MDNKGQFFLISTIIVAFSVTSIQFALAGYHQADASIPFTQQEDYIFKNVKDEFTETYESRECPRLQRELEEMELEIEEDLRRRRIDMDIDYDRAQPCLGDDKRDTTFQMNLTSQHYRIFDEFELTSP